MSEPTVFEGRGSDAPASGPTVWSGLWRITEHPEGGHSFDRADADLNPDDIRRLATDSGWGEAMLNGWSILVPPAFVDRPHRDLIDALEDFVRAVINDAASDDVYDAVRLQDQRELLAAELGKRIGATP